MSDDTESDRAYERITTVLIHDSEMPVALLGDHWRAGWPESFSGDELNPIWCAIAIGHATMNEQELRAAVVEHWYQGPGETDSACRQILWTIEGLADRPLWEEISRTFLPHVTAMLDQAVAAARDQNASA